MTTTTDTRNWPVLLSEINAELLPLLGLEKLTPDQEARRNELLLQAHHIRTTGLRGVDLGGLVEKFKDAPDDVEVSGKTPPLAVAPGILGVRGPRPYPQHDAAVMVCPGKDAECGDREAGWCADCPKREAPLRAEKAAFHSFYAAHTNAHGHPPSEFDIWRAGRRGHAEAPAAAGGTMVRVVRVPLGASLSGVALAAALGKSAAMDGEGR